MRLQNKVKQVTRVYLHLDHHISRFKAKSCLDCLPNCGRCCIKPDIMATVLEFHFTVNEAIRKALNIVSLDLQYRLKRA